MSEEQSVLRTTLLGSLLDVARFNASRGATELVICEQGGVYTASADSLPDEHRSLAALAHGGPSTDFSAIKGLLAAVLDTLRVPWTAQAHAEPFLHPGRSAAVIAGGDVVGWVGEVHPLVARDWDLGDVAAFELDIDAVVAAAVTVPRYESLSDYPAVTRDVSFWVPEGVDYADLRAACVDAAGGLLTAATLVDSYLQDNDSRRSYTLGFEFRANDRTLTDEEVDPQVAKIVNAATGLGAQQRV